MKQEKYTKKAAARILKEVLKVNPKASGFTSLDQAFVILMDHWDLELGIAETIKGEPKTHISLYRDGEIVNEWVMDSLWDDKEGDFDWDTIYKTVLEDTIKGKFYKRPKLGKRALKKLEESKKSKHTEVEESPITEATVTKIEPVLSIQDLRKKRDNLSVKIWDWKKKGKNVTELETELAEIKGQIKKLK